MTGPRQAAGNEPRVIQWGKHFTGQAGKEGDRRNKLLDARPAIETAELQASHSPSSACGGLWRGRQDLGDQREFVLTYRTKGRTESEKK